MRDDATTERPMGFTTLSLGVVAIITWITYGEGNEDLTLPDDSDHAQTLLLGIVSVVSLVVVLIYKMAVRGTVGDAFRTALSPNIHDRLQPGPKTELTERAQMLKRELQFA